ncbi:MAG: hypothetical protein KGY60_12010 [Bacteroidales bacterium]|nr:hypothetical protein [Bacteroidales bacterium]
MNRKLSRSEKLLLLLLGIALIGVIIKWNSVKEGVVKGWKHYNIEQWFSRD